MRKLIKKLYKKLFVRKAFYHFHTSLHTVGLWGMGILNLENDKESGEDFFLKQLKNYFKNVTQPLIFDVGANVGNYASKVKSFYPNAQVYSFEPHPKNYEQLLQISQKYGFKALNQGLGKEPGNLTLYDHSSEEGSEQATFYKGVIETLHQTQVTAYEVQVNTIDQFMQENQIQKIHFVKSDTEGNDFNVLLGAKEALNKGLIDIIQFEFNEMNVFSRVFLKDFLDLLPDYQFYRLMPDGMIKISLNPIFRSEIFAFQNIVAIHKELTDL